MSRRLKRELYKEATSNTRKYQGEEKKGGEGTQVEWWSNHGAGRKDEGLSGQEISQEKNPKCP